jgi:beta-lactamase class A
MNSRMYTFGFCVVAAIAFFAGMYVYSLVKKDAFVSCAQATHVYLNPDLDCLDTESLFSKISNTETQIKEYIKKTVSLNKAKRISVFYRDLNSRRWFGINQTELYTPASILKLPLAIAYHKLSEIDPVILSQEIIFISDAYSLNTNQYFKPEELLVVGKKYQIHELIDHMLMYSDNDAAKILVENINGNYHEKVLIDMGVHIPKSQEGVIKIDFFTVSTYAALFRSLYNSSYLSLDGSDKILNTLSLTKFEHGLAAGIPKTVKVANKFGEVLASDSETGNIIRTELHDCGIIYNPDKPYILCVMTDGTSFEVLSGIIADISKIVWENQGGGR